MNAYDRARLLRQERKAARMMLDYGFGLRKVSEAMKEVAMGQVKARLLDAGAIAESIAQELAKEHLALIEENQRASMVYGLSFVRAMEQGVGLPREEVVELNAASPYDGRHPLYPSFDRPARAEAPEPVAAAEPAPSAEPEVPAHEERRRACPKCEGNGEVPVALNTFGAFRMERCETCAGYGYLVPHSCGGCGGSGESPHLGGACQACTGSGETWLYPAPAW